MIWKAYLGLRGNYLEITKIILLTVSLTCALPEGR